MWVAFLTRHELLNKDSLPKELNDNSLKKALGVLNVMNFSEEEREAYEDHLKWLRIEANTLKKYEQKGREEGEAIGVEKGEVKKAIEMALIMLAEDEPLAKIIKYTNLTKEQIENLKQ
jgi:predicted transposase/invertase (TIGR01784 family)